jgi:hypothetical protein
MEVGERRPPEVPDEGTKSAWRILADAFNRYVMEGGMTHGAALTYYAVFSLGPLLLIATAMAGWVFGEAQANEELRDKLIEMFGADTAWTIEGLLSSVRARTGSGLAAAVEGFDELHLACGAHERGFLVEMGRALPRLVGRSDRGRVAAHSFAGHHDRAGGDEKICAG